MNRYILEEFHSNPALLRRRVMTAAHRDRARAMNAALGSLFAGIARLFGQLKARLTQRPARWIARLG